MGWLAACWNFLATGFGRAAFFARGVKAMKKEPKACQKMGLLCLGDVGLQGNPLSSCSFKQDFNHLSATPHSQSALTRNSPTAGAFSRISCGESKEQGWNSVREKLFVFLCLCPEGVLGQRRTKFPSWPSLLILLCLIFPWVLLKGNSHLSPSALSS